MNNIFPDSSTPHRQQEGLNFPFQHRFSVFYSVTFYNHSIHSIRGHPFQLNPPNRFLPATSLCIGYSSTPTPDTPRLSPPLPPLLLLLLLLPSHDGCSLCSFQRRCLSAEWQYSEIAVASSPESAPPWLSGLRSMPQAQGQV